MDTTEHKAMGTIRGPHRLLRGQPAPALDTWVFIDRGVSVPLPKGGVAYVYGQNGVVLVESLGDAALEGPINCAVVERAVWEQAAGAERAKTSRGLAWMAGAFAFAAFTVAWAILALPPGREVLFVLGLVGAMSSVVYSLVLWTGTRFDAAEATHVPLPKRKQDAPQDGTPSSGGGEEGALVALYVLAHNGHMHSDLIDTDGGSSGDSSGPSGTDGGDGGGGGGGGD